MNNLAVPLIKQYTPLVKKIAYNLLNKLPQSILLDDLIQAGMIGLLEAAKHYDASRGACFETYAGIRIRGSIFDEVRSYDWAPRSVRRNSRTLAEAERKVANRAGRDAKDCEVAEELGIGIDEFHELQQDSSLVQLHAFDELTVTDEAITVNHSVEPDAAAQREDLYTNLVAIIEVLPDKERMVLSLYYDQDLNLKEIGIILHISESRVCQIHSQAMQHIKEKLNDV